MKIYAAYQRRGIPQTILTRGGTIILIVILLVSLVNLIKRLSEPTVISPLTAHATSQPNQHVVLLKRKDPLVFQEVIHDAIDDSIPEYSIIVDDFLTNFHGEAGDQIPYTAASVQKIPILIALYEQIQKGVITKDKNVTLTEDERQDYGTGSIRYDPAGTSYTVHELADKMIKDSDNTAAYILARKVMNMKDIQATVHGWGLGETNLDDNFTTNANMNLLFRKLFTGQILNATYTREVIAELENSNYEDRIPALLPKKAHVYHKEGTAVAGLHDVGVVVGDKSLYYIGIFTSNVAEEDRATRAIARVSKAVYDFMQGE